MSLPSQGRACARSCAVQWAAVVERFDRSAAEARAMIVFERSRHITASPSVVWSVGSDVTRWPEWFTEAELCAVLSVSGVGQRQTMFGHAEAKATEIDSVITFFD